MTVTLDTSVLAAFFVQTDVFAARAREFLAGLGEVPFVSDFVVAEFASVVARLTRTGHIDEAEARKTFAMFDAWHAKSAENAEMTAADIRLAITIIRRLDLNIRAPDAIHLAIALRLGASVATFDRGMAANAQMLGVTVAGI